MYTHTQFYIPTTQSSFFHMRNGPLSRRDKAGGKAKPMRRVLGMATSWKLGRTLGMTPGSTEVLKHRNCMDSDWV